MTSAAAFFKHINYFTLWLCNVYIFVAPNLACRREEDSPDARALLKVLFRDAEQPPRT
jgi:hypothetical protein